MRSTRAQYRQAHIDRFTQNQTQQENKNNEKNNTHKNTMKKKP